MFLKRLTLTLAFMLTMFAVSAKAINCSTPPLECFGSTGSGSSSVSVSFTGPGGTIICTYDFCYCYQCPSPSDPPETPMKISVWDIQSVNGCTEIDLEFVYSEIREGLTSPAFVLSKCGVPPCGSGEYRYLEYRMAACWHSFYIGSYLHFQPCEDCTAECIDLLRFCMHADGYFYIQPLSSTRVGEITCDDCETTGWGPSDTSPSLPGGCYHVCD